MVSSPCPTMAEPGDVPVASEDHARVFLRTGRAAFYETGDPDPVIPAVDQFAIERCLLHPAEFGEAAIQCLLLNRMRHGGCGGRVGSAELLTGAEGAGSRPVRKIPLFGVVARPLRSKAGARAISTAAVMSPIAPPGPDFSATRPSPIARESDLSRHQSRGTRELALAAGS